MDAKASTFTKAVSQSQTFWSLVYGALLEATLSRLCRAYDQNADALTLRTLVETVRRQPPFLPSPANPVSPEELAADIAAVSQDTNQIVCHVTMWRHKLVAHRDVGKIINARSLGEEFPITYDDVHARLTNGFRIVNRYSVAFFSGSRA